MTMRKLSTTRDILRFEGADRPAYWRRFAMLLGLSVVIATMGLLRDSAAVVIAAMLIAPLMTPILGIASALVMGWLGRAAWLVLAVCVAAVLCVLMAWLLVHIADVPKGIRLPGQVLARTDPGTEDLVVALAAGVAGAYVQINRSEISLLPGAAIGVSLVPPLSASGVLLYFEDYTDAYEAALLFATNLGAIILSASVVYIIYSARALISGKIQRKRNFTAGMILAVAFLGLIIVQLGSATYNRYLETRQEAALMQAIRDWADPVSVETLRIDVDAKRKQVDLWLIVDLPLDAQFQVASIATMMPEHLRDNPLIDVLRAHLGPDYSATVRYQTRIAGRVDLLNRAVDDAPSVEDADDDSTPGDGL
ncbi:MAG: DUF389 domain-containing protein [Marinibacterium sp.]|nr:DUF389 domain-containing protein [Marinibacterium sp.]